MFERIQALGDAYAITDEKRTEVWKRYGADETWNKMLRVQQYLKLQQRVAYLDDEQQLIQAQ